jgi:hypothetical protein
MDLFNKYRSSLDAMGFSRAMSATCLNKPAPLQFSKRQPTEFVQPNAYTQHPRHRRFHRQFI